MLIRTYMWGGLSKCRQRGRGGLARPKKTAYILRERHMITFIHIHTNNLIRLKSVFFQHVFFCHVHPRQDLPGGFVGDTQCPSVSRQGGRSAGIHTLYGGGQWGTIWARDRRPNSKPGLQPQWFGHWPISQLGQLTYYL